MYEAFMILLAVAMLFTFINLKFFKIQLTIGLLLMGMVLSGIILLIKIYFPATFNVLPPIVAEIDFQNFLMNGILSFLLFAGAISINVEALNKERLSVFMFAIVGTIISTVIVGYLSYYGFMLIGLEIPLLHCMLFGALISPTDPIAVMAIFKDLKMRQDISVKIEGESLFNDGIGIVLFITISQLMQSNGSHFSMMEFSSLFLREAIGGIVFGLVLGGGASYLLKLMKDDPESAILITLVVTTGGYALASVLHISGALAMVSAGLMVGSWINKYALDATKLLVKPFWKILDGVFNSVLFVLMGLVILIVDPEVVNFGAASIAILVVLIARFVSVAIPYALVDKRVSTFPWFNVKIVSVMTWSGLRGALAFALALSVDVNYHGHFFVFLTYCVVAFSILVQGSTIGKLVKKEGVV